MAHTRRRLLGSVALLVALLGAALAPQAAAARGAGSGPGSYGPVVLDAQIACPVGGGLELTFTITNHSHATIVIDQDFRLSVTTRSLFDRGVSQTTILFVYPASGFETIPPGESRTFSIPVGDAQHGTLTRAQFVVEADVWLIGDPQPVTARFKLTGC